jgi:hypothetical protein
MGGASVAVVMASLSSTCNQRNVGFADMQGHNGKPLALVLLAGPLPRHGHRLSVFSSGAAG